MRKLLALFTLAILALIGVPGAASASVVPVGEGQVSAGTVTDGGQVTFSGCGFVPGETVTIREDGDVEGTVTADGEGCFSTTVTVNGVGDAVLTATGAARVVSATVRVMAASAGAPGTGSGSDAGGLPVTGAEGTATQVWAGIGLLGLGAGVVALTVSRRRVATSTTA